MVVEHLEYGLCGLKYAVSMKYTRDLNELVQKGCEISQSFLYLLPTEVIF